MTTYYLIKQTDYPDPITYNIVYDIEGHWVKLTWSDTLEELLRDFNVHVGLNDSLCDTWINIYQTFTLKEAIRTESYFETYTYTILLETTDKSELTLSHLQQHYPEIFL